MVMHEYHMVECVAVPHHVGDYAEVPRGSLVCRSDIASQNMLRWDRFMFS